ncbi:myb-like protein X [Vespula squamosa]|uniref:Myb-like protein X n=1 Tax=Vespula squamosa TaxID=30214 RepID=A0ABD2BK11_VESSQ
MLVLKTNTTLLYKDLFEWWNEETEYIFRRIRKSAALARGYNRLSLERLSEDQGAKYSTRVEQAAYSALNRRRDQSCHLKAK